MNKTCVIVGAGISGLTVGRILAENGYIVKIFEKRDHIGGNLYDYYENGFLIHKYGPHTLHTNNEAVLSFVKRFSDWDEFVLDCGAYFNNKFIKTPFSFDTLYELFPSRKVESIIKKLTNTYTEDVSILDLLDNPDEEIHEFAEILYQNDYLPYAIKQWNLKPTEIDRNIFKRVKIKLSRNVHYFNDKYQLMPKNGYVAFLRELANHKNISICYSTDGSKFLEFKKDRCLYMGENCIIIYTGPLDYLFKNKFGTLPYRSLTFEIGYSEHSIQPFPVVAYPLDSDFTRITEYKRLTNQNIPGEIFVKEYSLASNQSAEPYYPIPCEKNNICYNAYLSESKKYSNFYPLGRLATYKYLNMDEAINNALSLAEQILNKYNIH